MEIRPAPADDQLSVTGIRDRMQSQLHGLSEPARPHEQGSDAPRNDAVGIELSSLQAFVHTVQQRSSEVGQLPRCPPTLRGRFGQILIRVIQRLLFWYTPNITRFHELLSHVIQEQFAALSRVSVLLQQRAEENADLRAGMDALEQKLHAEIAGLRETKTGQVREISKLTSHVIRVQQFVASEAQNHTELQESVVDLRRAQQQLLEENRGLQTTLTETARHTQERLQTEARVRQAAIADIQRQLFEENRALQTTLTETALHAQERLQAEALARQAAIADVQHQLVDSVRRFEESSQALAHATEASIQEANRAREREVAAINAAVAAAAQVGQQLRANVEAEALARQAAVADVQHQLVNSFKRHEESSQAFARATEASIQEANGARERDVAAVNAAIAAVTGNCNRLAAQLAQEGQQLRANVEAETQSRQVQGSELRLLIDAETAGRRPIERTVSHLRTALIAQERRISVLIDETRRRFPQQLDATQLQNLIGEEQHRLDALYLSFEDDYRGTREEIKDRVRVYLPHLAEAGIGQDAAVLDLGCGRGEWLEVLTEAGFQVRGIDRNRAMVSMCRERGLQVEETDAIQYLRSQPDASLGLITGFHILEHLPLPVLINLLDETVRTLKPGGLAIFETPNPRNVLVSTHTFYLDPTHCHPLPSMLLQFLAEARGMGEIKIIDLHPYPESMRLQESTAVEKRFNTYFYGPQDYAILGKKKS